MLQTIDLENDEDNEVVTNNHSIGSTEGTPVVDYLMQRYLETHDKLWLDELRSML